MVRWSVMERRLKYLYLGNATNAKIGLTSQTVLLAAHSGLFTQRIRNENCIILDMNFLHVGYLHCSHAAC
jgi:hypothetical protein